LDFDIGAGNVGVGGKHEKVGINADSYQFVDGAVESKSLGQGLALLVRSGPSTSV
jgi:hypothetical protein